MIILSYYLASVSVFFTLFCTIILIYLAVINSKNVGLYRFVRGLGFGSALFFLVMIALHFWLIH